MNKQQFESLDETSAIEEVIYARELENQSDRTLLYGYTCDRWTWHVYLFQGEITLYCYQDVYQGEPIVHKAVTIRSFAPDHLIPDKRLYPEACDHEFCVLLRLKGKYLPFTIFNETRKPAQYHGLILKEHWR